MYHFIINPASRSGKGERLWKELIEPTLIARKAPYRVHFSRTAGEVVPIVEGLLKEYNGNPLHLVVLGGDGTINETLQGISHFETVTVSYIPTGSSNDLARDMGIRQRPAEILEQILDSGKTVSMDIGLLTSSSGEHRFAVSCGIGFDAAVCEESMTSKLKYTLNRMGLGKLTYLVIAIKQLFAAKRASCDLYLDDKAPIHLDKILFVATMNHRYEGGGLKFCPDASWNDGFLDLCVVAGLPKLIILFVLPTAFFGKHFIFPGVHSFRAKEVRIKASRPLWVHTDGEVWEQNEEIHMCIQPQKLQFHY